MHLQRFAVVPDVELIGELIRNLIERYDAVRIERQPGHAAQVFLCHDLRKIERVFAVLCARQSETFDRVLFIEIELPVIFPGGQRRKQQLAEPVPFDMDHAERIAVRRKVQRLNRRSLHHEQNELAFLRQLELRKRGHLIQLHVLELLVGGEVQALDHRIVRIERLQSRIVRKIQFRQRMDVRADKVREILIVRKVQTVDRVVADAESPEVLIVRNIDRREIIVRDPDGAEVLQHGHVDRRELIV